MLFNRFQPITLAGMGLLPPTRRYTAEEYLRLEQDAVDKHQYYRGEIFAMSGGPATHSLINANLIRVIGNALLKSPCRVYDSNLRLRVPRTTLYTYPDATIVCGEHNFDPQDPFGQTVLNPTLVAEVLSPSTEAYDRGAKFENYQQIDSLREYVLVSQEVIRVETFLRQPSGNWLYAAAGVGSSVHLASLHIQLTLEDMYAGAGLSPLLSRNEGNAAP
jgi:Uma2 family endonuclease